MIKKNVLVITVMAMMFALSTFNLEAEGNTAAPEKVVQKMNSPFLITGKLPHLTKLLMQKWESPELRLTDDQKSKLLVIREETILAVQRIGREIAPLEQQVAAGIFAGKQPEEFRLQVQKVAEMKAEATMVHLRCIYATKAILDKQQLDFLKN